MLPMDMRAHGLARRTDGWPGAVIGAEYSRESLAMRESMIAVTLEILRRVDPTGRYVREDNELVQGAARTGPAPDGMAAAANAAAAQGVGGQGTDSPGSARPEGLGSKDSATLNAGVVGMRGLLWKDSLHGEHRKEILTAHQKEFNGLTSTILKELFPGDAEYRAAQCGTNC